MPVHLNPKHCLAGWHGCLLLLAFITSGLAAAHPYHQSLLELELDARNGQLQGALKLLPEDFASIQQTADIATYLQQHLRLSVDGKPLEMTVLGSEKSPKAVWLYLSWPVTSRDCPAHHRLQLTDTVLFEINDHFVNTVTWQEQADGQSQRKAHNLTPDEARLSLDLTALQAACVNQNNPAARRQ
jgi:hypothetical protein